MSSLNFLYNICQFNQMNFFHESLKSSRLLSQGQNIDIFRLHIKDDVIEIPLEVAKQLSPEIANLLAQDPTYRNFEVPITLKNPNSFNYIVDLLNRDSSTVPENLNYQVYFDIIAFGYAIGNNFLILAFKDKLNRDISQLTMEDLLQTLEFKLSLNEHLSAENELQYLAKNFYKINNNPIFIDWCSKEGNISAIEMILSHKELLLSKEDQLFEWIFFLIKKNKIYLILLNYLYIEYCSQESLKKLIEFIKNDSDFQSQTQISVINCFSRRILTSKENLPILPRYIQASISEQQIIKNPRLGILNQEHLKNNLILCTSPVRSDDNVYNLLKISDGGAFGSTDTPGSAILVILKNGAPFTVEKYLLRGNPTDYNQMQSWILEGRDPEKNIFVTLDERTVTLQKSASVVFTPRTVKRVTAVRLTQTSKTTTGRDFLYLSGFELYGEV